jgi:hypothetical protein
MGQSHRTAQRTNDAVGPTIAAVRFIVVNKPQTLERRFPKNATGRHVNTSGHKYRTDVFIGAEFSACIHINGENDGGQ